MSPKIWCSRVTDLSAGQLNAEKNEARLIKISLKDKLAVTQFMIPIIT